jgi:proton-coupled amino acid transporter
MPHFVLKVFLFEGSITLLVPLQESVQEPSDRLRFAAVYNKRVILSIVGFYAVFGLSCWMAFGHNVNTILTTSLPEGFLATMVQLSYSIAVIFTFPLQNFPALEIAIQSIAKTFAGRCVCRNSILSYQVISSALVCLLALVAVTALNSLDKQVVSLAGSLLGCPLAFVFPPLIHCQLDPNLAPWRI